MKTNRLICIALVTIMALTVVSGAGVLRAAAWLVNDNPSSTDIAAALDCPDYGFTKAWSGTGKVATRYGDSGFFGSNALELYALTCDVTAYPHTAGWATVSLTVSGPGTLQFAWGGFFGAGATLEHLSLSLFDTTTTGTTQIRTGPIASTQSGWDTSDPDEWNTVIVPLGPGEHTLTWKAAAADAVSNEWSVLYAFVDHLSWVTEGSTLARITTLQSDNIAFSNLNNHKAFDAKLEAVYKLVDTGTATSYALAMDKIQIDLMPKTDGTAPDWVTATYQKDIYDKLQMLYNDIETLQSAGFYPPLE